MWSIQRTELFARKLKHFAKKHPNELQAMLSNLDTYERTLNAGVQPMQVQHGFMHRESMGAIGIDQKGAKGSPKQTRLYVYPDSETKTVHLVTIGDKKSQQGDNQECRDFITALRNRAT